MPMMGIVVFVVKIVFGGNGNLWREKNLISRGYEQVHTVTAATSEEAVALYLKNRSA